MCMCIMLIPPLPTEFLFPAHQKLIQSNKKKIKTSISAVVIAPLATIFILISYSFETKIMLILNLIDGQYSQNALFSFEKCSNRQNHSSSGCHHLVKKFLSSVHYFLTQSPGNS